MAATVCPKCNFKFQNNDAQQQGSTVFCPSCKGSFQTESLPPEQPLNPQRKAKPKKVKDADDGVPIRANRGGGSPFAGWTENWTSPAHASQIYSSVAIVALSILSIGMVWACSFFYASARRASAKSDLKAYGKNQQVDPYELHMTLSSFGIGGGYLVLALVIIAGFVSWAYFGNSSRGARVAVASGLCGMCVATCGCCFMTYV